MTYIITIIFGFATPVLILYYLMKLDESIANFIIFAGPVIIFFLCYFILSAYNKRQLSKYRENYNIDNV
jgi:hypothetical protein